MRHGDKIKNLNRKASHRKATLASLAKALIFSKRIETTLAKAKALRVYVEPLITRAKEENNTTSLQSTHNRRTVFAYLTDKEAIKELFSVIAPKVANRAGGYTRIIKLGTRAGDAAEVAIIELVDFNETYQKETKATATKKTRRRGKGKGKEEATKPTEQENQVEVDNSTSVQTNEQTPDNQQ
ncbi:MAG: 50S ribosomal protein L17 [Thermonemataceae bacterium]|nr:50S ribosomal protein L17 [Thermonemataceae bacterium]